MAEEIVKSLKQLKEELIGLGMPAEAVEAFSTKGQLMSVITTLQASKASQAELAATKPEVQKVKTLDAEETPQEKRSLDKQWLSKALIMQDILMKEPMVNMLLPLSGKEKPGVVEWRTDKHGKKFQYVVSGSFEAPQLNGCKWIVPKGVYVDVPKRVAEVLRKSYMQTAQAGSNISMDRIDDRTGKPMKEIL